MTEALGQATPHCEAVLELARSTTIRFLKRLVVNQAMLQIAHGEQPKKRTWVCEPDLG